METCRYCLLKNHSLPIKKRLRCCHRHQPETVRCTCLMQRRAGIRSRNPNMNYTPDVSHIVRRPNTRRVSIRLRTRGLQQTRHTRTIDNSAAEINTEEGSNSETECAICLETETGEDKKQLPCRHSFHEVCIDAWLENRNTCPVCRRLADPDRARQDVESRIRNITARLRLLFSVLNLTQATSTALLQNIQDQMEHLSSHHPRQ